MDTKERKRNRLGDTIKKVCLRRRMQKSGNDNKQKICEEEIVEAFESM